MSYTDTPNARTKVITHCLALFFYDDNFINEHNK